jgi:hypothetical protein
MWGIVKAINKDRNAPWTPTVEQCNKALDEVIGTPGSQQKCDFKGKGNGWVSKVDMHSTTGGFYAVEDNHLIGFLYVDN